MSLVCHSASPVASRLNARASISAIGRESGGDHRLLVLLERSSLEGDWPTEDCGEDRSDVGVREQFRSGQPVFVAGVGFGAGGDVRGHGRDVSSVDEADASIARS